ncbi:Transmembrane protein 65 [Sciurus carolinensis]|uniref:Transmembrane protein 65 n=1 Tax=Sciurus carolinensis TaxID=30640 RepID=A0AA41T839_SCICA|nr:Transmembrane protein 65 [Sciurus carolinensis]
MSRLLPLLRSRTARSLRPGPAAAAAPRPPSWCCCGRGLLALAAPGGPRSLGTHPKKEPMEALNTPQGARDFIYSLHSTERSCLLKELHRFESIAIAQEKLEAPPPTPGQLRYVSDARDGTILSSDPLVPGAGDTDHITNHGQSWEHSTEKWNWQRGEGEGFPLLTGVNLFS